MPLAWLSLKGIKDPENHLTHTQLLPGEKLSEALWEPTDQPVSSDTSGLKYVSINGSKNWSKPQLNQHQQSIEALKALLGDCAENKNPLDHEEARIWFKNHALQP